VSEPTEQAPAVPSVKPLRVAWVAGERTLGRLAPMLKALAIGLVDAPAELVVLCPAGESCEALPSPPLDVVPYEPARWWERGFGAIREVADDLAGRKLDLLHALDARADRLTRRLAAALDTPYVVSSDALGDGRILGKLPDHARALLAAGDRIQADLLEHRVLSAERVHLVRPGLRRVQEPSCFADPGRAAAVLIGGALDTPDDVEPTLRALAALRAGGHECQGFLLGEGRAERKLRQRAEQLALREALTFAGTVPAWRLAGVLAGSDIYVSPSTRDGLDVGALAAMAVGVPVVSAKDAPSDFLKEGRTTVQFRRGDADNLRDEIGSLLADPPRAKALAEQALAYLGEYHAPTATAAKTADIYRQALA